MNDYEISKLKKELQRKQQLLKEEQQDRIQTEKQLVQVSAERDKFHTQLLIARKQIQNIDKIIADNVRTMKSKLEADNSNALNQLKDLRQKVRQQQLSNQKYAQENRDKDTTIAELSARLRQLSKKYKDPSLLVNTNQIKEQARITHNDFFKLNEKYNKLSKDMQNIMAENKILRKLHGVPDNFGFDLEQIKIAQKQQLEDYKAQCRKLQTQIEQLEAERTQLRYRLRQYNTLYSNKGERYKDMTQQQLQLLDLYAINLKQGKYELPQIDKSQKEMERQILKLRAQVQVLQNKYPISMGPSSNGNIGGNDKLANQQMKKMQQQIKSYLEPFVQDIRKLSETNLSGLIKNLQNLPNVNSNQLNINVPNSNFKGPIPLPVAHNDWSKIKEGYSFIYQSKIPVDMKELQGDVSFDIMKAKYEVAALQLQNIQSLKLLKQKQKIENHLSQQLFDLKEKYKKCLKVQDELFIRYFKEKQNVNDKLKKLQIQKHQLNNEKAQLQSKLQIISASYNDLSKKGDLQRRLNQNTSRLAISEAQVLKWQRKYQIVQEQQKTLRQTYKNLQGKTIEAEYSLKQKLINAKNNQTQLTVLVNKILDEVKGSVSAQVHNVFLQKAQLLNDRLQTMTKKEAQLIVKVAKLQSVERDAYVKDDIVQNLREDNLQILLELEIVRNRLRTIDIDYRIYCEVFDRLIKFINDNNISLMSYFKKFDRDHSGQLDRIEFSDSLNALGFKLTPEQLNLLYGQFDLDGSEKVTYKEFIKKMRRGGAISRTKQQEAVLKLFKAIEHSGLSIQKAFKIIDADGSNSIQKSQMTSALSRIGIQTASQTVDFLFKMCDYDGDGSISCSELQRLYKQMIRQSKVIQKQVYCQEIDWKLAFVLKLEEVSLRFKSSLAQTFKKLDDDGNSVLTMTQLSEFIKIAEMSIQTSALRQLFDFLDIRKDGRIQYGQFLKTLAQAKAEQKRIERIKYIKQRTKQLKIQSQIIINSKSNINIESQKNLSRNGEMEKLKIRIEALQTKHSNLLKRSEKLAAQLASKQQKVKQLQKDLQSEQKQKQNYFLKLNKQRQNNITLQELTEKGLSERQSNQIKRQNKDLIIKNTQLFTDLERYKCLFESLTDKNKQYELQVGKQKAQLHKYYDIVKQLQGTSDLKAQVGKLNIQIQYSKRNQQIISSKYDRIIQDLRKIDVENKKLSDISIEKEKQIINTHMFFQQKSKLLQLKIDDLSLKIIPTITIDKMQEFIVKLRQISSIKSGLEQENKTLREKNYNIQARNDYIENEKLHIEQLQKKLRNKHDDESSKNIIDLTKKLSQYKMGQLKAKRELNLLKQKQQYYLRINNTHTDNIKQLQTQLSNWEVKFNEREEFWRKRLADQLKLMESFQKEATKAKEQQMQAISYFQQKNDEKIVTNKKYQNLSKNNYDNISQFIKNPSQNINAMNDADNDKYTEDLLNRIHQLEQELMQKDKEIAKLKTAWKDVIPESKYQLNDFGSQMNVSSNSFVLQTQLTGSQLKNNARRFLNNQKQIEQYYKQQNARITQVAHQSVMTLQNIIDDKNEQLRKKQRTIQELKRQFNQSSQKDCLEIQKLHEEIRQLRSKAQMISINDMMSRTTKQNFHPSSKAEGKLEEYQQLVYNKDQQIKSLQEKYDKLVISKSSTNKQNTASKNARNQERLNQTLEELKLQRQAQKRNYLNKESKFQQQISNLKKVVNTKTKKIQQLNNALKDIKNDIVNEKSSLTQVQAEQNLKIFVENMSKGANKNDAVVEQYLQSALVKIKTLQGQNKDLKDQLNRAKDANSKTMSKLGR